MKRKSKQFVAAVVAASMCIVPITPASEVRADDVVPYTNSRESAFQGLSEQNKLIAREAKNQILQIAEGKRSDAILRISLQSLGMDPTDPQYRVSAASLGFSASDFDENGIANTYNPSVKWQEWAENNGYFGYYYNGAWKQINHALWEDCSFELFWHEKTIQGIAAWPVSVVYYPEDGTVGPDENSFVPLVMGIRSAYRGETSTNDIYDSYYTGIGQTTNVNADAAAAETNTVLANALAVVNQYAGLSDTEKLTAYRDYILDAVTYDT